MSQALFWHIKVIKLDPCPPKSALLGPFSKLKIILFIYLVSKIEGYSWNKVFFFVLFTEYTYRTGSLKYPVYCSVSLSKLMVQGSVGTRPVLCFTGSSLSHSASTRYCVSLLSNSVYWSSAQEIGRKKGWSS